MGALMTAYYNEHDPQAAAWLRELIKQGHIAPGIVDERDIRDVKPYELMPYTQCHFFAGIGVWSHALRQAGWSDDRPVWTGSCPCQPFSAAGRGAGFTDERHLWPHWYHLITQCRPSVVFGEQVASKDGLAWLDLVQADMEATDYAFGAVDLCAAGVGAPHIRQRLWFVGERLADAMPAGRAEGRAGAGGGQAAGGSELGGLANPEGAGGCGREPLQNRADNKPGRSDPLEFNELPRSAAEHLSPTNGLWADADWLFCRDGKWRPVEPGTFPLAHGAPARVGRLRGYGNAINAEAARFFIEAYDGALTL